MGNVARREESCACPVFIEGTVEQEEMKVWFHHNRKDGGNMEKKNEFYAIANTNERGLVFGRTYMVTKVSYGTVDVYDQINNIIVTHRADNFDNYQPIERKH